MSKQPGSKAGAIGAGKSERGAARLLGKLGAPGLGLSKGGGLPASATGVPKAADLSKVTKSHGNEQGPPAATKHPGKPETRRPTGRAISGS